MRKGCTVDLNDVAYHLGHETIVQGEKGKRLPRWQAEIFSAMERNVVHVSDDFRLPNDNVVEIGRHIAI